VKRPTAADRRGVDGNHATDIIDVVAMGEALWDLVGPRGVPLAEARSLALRPGGAAVNVAITLAGQGFRTALCATVGADALGEALVARVAALGVSTAFVERVPARTGIVVAERSGDAPRVVSYRSGDEGVPALPPGVRARLLISTGVLPSDAHAESFAAAARTARSVGASVVVDLNARPRMWRGQADHAARVIEAAVRDADVVKASEDDLGTLAQTETDLRARMRASAVLLVTAGARAVRATGPFGVIDALPRQLRTMARGDALGAGDAFICGVADRMLRSDARDHDFWQSAVASGVAFGRRRVAQG